jgi:hypothetical protein
MPTVLISILAKVHTLFLVVLKYLVKYLSEAYCFTVYLCIVKNGKLVSIFISDVKFCLMEKRTKYIKYKYGRVRNCYSLSKVKVIFEQVTLVTATLK